MSMILMAKAMQLKVGNPTRKLVLLKLADNANDQGECWPSYQNIADHCEISRRSVIAHINALEEAGLLRKISRKGTHHGNASNIFVLSLDGEKSAPPKTKNTNGLAGENNSLPSEHISPPSELDALGGGEPRSPRTSHSFEPVIEPIVCNTSHSTDSAFEVFWSAGMVKTNKKRALSLFQSICKKQKLEPFEFANKLADDVKRRLAAGQFGFNSLHPTTYLNNERWNDDAVVNDKPLALQNTQVTDDLNDTSWMNESEDWL